MRPTRKLLPSLPTSVIAAGLVLVAAPLVPVIASTQSHPAAVTSTAADAFGVQPTVTRPARPDVSAATLVNAAKLLAVKAALREDHQDAAERHARAVARQAQIQAQPSPPAPAPTQSAPPGQAPAVGSPQAYALKLLGGDTIQFGCLDNIWTRESGWNYQATNPNSGAYGIPQALPGSKMATAGADWQTNPLTQVRWGVGYVNSQYGSACAAWMFWQGHGYY